MAAQSAVPTLAETLPHIIQRSLRARASAVALREKRLGLWRSLTWGGLWSDVERVVLGLMARGFAAGDVALLLSGNSAAWVQADLGVLCAGGTSAAIYPAISPEQLVAVIRSTGASVIFVDDEEQLEKALEAKALCPGLLTIVVLAPEGPVGEDDVVLEFDSLMRLAEGRPGGVEEVQKRIDAVSPDDTAIITFTSGTTGAPRAVPLSHRNVCAAVEHLFSAIPATEDERLVLLPLCHPVERIVGLYASIAAGSIIHFPEGADTAFENLRELQPTTVLAIPRIWEKLRSGILLALADATPLQRAAYRKAIELGGKAHELRCAGQPLPGGLAAMHAIYDRLVLKPIRRMMGLDRTRWVMSCSAPVSQEVVGWYGALGVRVLELYGQAETACAVAVAPLDAPRPGTVGRILPGVEVKTGMEGEILVRGANVFAGYLGAPGEPGADGDGWFHTGDVGRVDQGGYLTVTDRMANVIVTASGERVQPGEIENRLNLSPYIADSVVIGQGRAFLSCLVLIDYDNVVRFAQDKSIPFTNFQSLCRADAVYDLIRGEIDLLNAQPGLPRIEGFRLIDVELAPGDEELTPALKLRRAVVARRFQSVIDTIYARAA